MDRFDAIDYLILGVSLAFSWWASYQLEGKANKNHPDRKPYTWGYFVGVGALTSGALYALLMFYAALEAYRDKDILIALGFLFAIHSIAGYYVIKRKKIAWVISTVLLLNPIGWIVNGIYAKNRWSELHGVTDSNTPAVSSASEVKGTLSSQIQSSYKTRLLLFSLVSWIVAVFAIVFIFDIYGSSISSREWKELLKIALTPPLLILVGYFGYLKFVK